MCLILRDLHSQNQDISQQDEKNASGLQLHLQNGSQHAGSDALPLPSRQAAADWLKSTFKKADALLTFRLLANKHTLT